MPDTGIAAYNDLRDPLWRLAPTPFSVRACIGRLRVRVECNDPQIFASLAKLIPDVSMKIEDEFLWRIIRDPEAAGDIESVAIVVDGDLTFVKMGSGVFAGVDKERKELLGFVGMGVCEHELEEVVLPLFVQITLDATEDGTRGAALAVELAPTRGNGNE